MSTLALSNPKATVCTQDICVTLFGPAAQVVTFATVVAVVAIVASLIAKIAD
jgi:hypothetical protein